MKKILLIVLMFAFMATGLFAKVTIIEEGGKMVAVVTHSTTYNDYPQLNIIGSFMNWQKPGAPMYRNDKGEWEYKIVLDAPMVKYKFYDPRVSDDSAYIDDTESDNKVANPFGSYDWLIKRPKKPSGGTGGAEEEEDFAPVFGMWARVAYNLQFTSDMGQKIVRDKSGEIVYSGYISSKINDKGEYTYDDASVANKTYYVIKDGVSTKVTAQNSETEGQYAYADNEIGFAWAPWRFAGENGTTKGDYTRVVLGRDSLAISTTLKFHGKVSKYFKADVEVNAQTFYANDNSRVWQNGVASDGGTMSLKYDSSNKNLDLEQLKKDREQWWNNRVRNNVSNFISTLFGGLGRDYVFAKQYYNNPNSNQSNGVQQDKAGTNYDAGHMHVDQVQFGWTTKDFDLNVAGAGGKSLYSKDPMALISGDRIGSTNYVQSNIIALIHPDKVKGLNVNFGTTYSGATKNYSGGGATPKQDDPSYGQPIDSEIGRYLLYTDIYYNILGKSEYTIGLIYTMDSYAPNKFRNENFIKDWTGLDSFSNATHEMAFWAKIAPSAVKGLSMNVEAATEIPTRYFSAANGYLQGNSLYGTGVEIKWEELKVAKTGFDFLAQSAIYFDIGYSYNSLFSLKAYLAGAGRLFRGNMAGNGSTFAGYMDIWTWNMTGYSRSHGSSIGKTTGGLDLEISPITTDPELLKIKVSYDILVGGLGSNLYYDNLVSTYNQEASDNAKKTFSLSNRWKPSVSSSFKAGTLDMKINVGIDLALDTNFGVAFIGGTRDESSNTVTGGSKKDVSTNVFTFRGANLGVDIGNISETLKSVGIAYELTMRNYGAPSMGAPGAVVTQKEWDRFNNTWNMKLLYNTISADFRFKNDISVLGAFILRYTHGAINADWSGTTNNAGEYTKPNDNDKTALANYYSIPDYWSWGLAFQFKYVIPVKILKTPILFCNLSFGWDPFQYYDPGYLETMDYNSSNYDRGTAADWSQNNIHSFQFSQLTVGLQWDF